MAQSTIFDYEFPMSIPKIIHQIWKDDNIPHHVFEKEWMESWKIWHPNWQYVLWTDEKSDEFVKMSYPHFYPVYCSYDRDIKRADSLRYLLMNTFGGIYADLDFVCLKNLEILFSENTCYLTLEPEHTKRFFSLSLIASIPQHPFWECCIQELVRKSAYKKLGVIKATGPELLDEAYVKFNPKSTISIIEDHEIFPWCGGKHDIPLSSIESPNNHAIHFNKSVWTHKRKGIIENT